MSKRKPLRRRPHRFAAVIEQLEKRSLLTAIAWDGGGDGTNWHDPVNWSGNALPGSNDDVTINVAANPTIQFTSAAGDVQIRSLNCAETFNLAGGGLTVTAGSSAVTGALALSGGGLAANGAGTSFTASGTTTATSANLFAISGGMLSLPNLTTYQQPLAFNRFVADGASSKLLLPNVTSIAGNSGSSQDFLAIRAFNGGLIDLSALPQLTSSTRVELLASGKDASNNASLVNVSALSSFAGHAFYSSTIQIDTGGEVRVNNALTTLDRVNLSVGLGTLKTTQLTSVTRASIFANGGGVLSLPGITSYQQPLAFTIFQADGAGSKLLLPNLTSLTGDAGGSQDILSVRTFNGGTVDMSALAALGSSAHIDLIGNGKDVSNNPSLIKLTSLSSFTGHQVYNSSIQIASGAQVQVNNALTTLDRVNLAIGAGTFNSTQLTSITRGSIFVSGGGVLSLPGITSYQQNLAFTIFQASEAGSQLLLPNLTSLTGDPGNSQDLLSIRTYGGGTVNMSALTQIGSSAHVDLLADGNSSLVNLSALSSFTGHQIYNSNIFIGNGGEVRVNNALTSLDRVHFTMGVGTFKTAQLTSITRGNILANGGGTVSFPAITSYQQNLNFTVFQAQETGTKLQFPNLTSIAGDPGLAQDILAFRAFSGSTIDISALPQLGSSTRIEVSADGPGTVINLSSLTSFTGHQVYNSSLFINSGAEVKLNNTLTTFTRVPIFGGGVITGSVSTNSEIRPGGDIIATLTVTGNFTQTAGSTLTVQLAGPVVGTSFDRLTVNGTASLTGTLNLVITNAYVPTYLTQHAVIGAAARTGKFQTINGIVITPQKYLAVTYTGTGMNVTAAIPGDANLDGTVSTPDFTMLSSKFNQSDQSWSEAEFTGNNKVNAIDFNTIAAFYGQSVPPAVPLDLSSPGAPVQPSIALAPAMPIARDLFSIDPIPLHVWDAADLDAQLK